MRTSYLCKIADDVCFLWSIKNNIFVINNKGNDAYLTFEPGLRQSGSQLMTWSSIGKKLQILMWLW